jgi:hypothetical protein
MMSYKMEGVITMITKSQLLPAILLAILSFALGAITSKCIEFPQQVRIVEKEVELERQRREQESPKLAFVQYGGRASFASDYSGPERRNDLWTQRIDKRVSQNLTLINIGGALAEDVQVVIEVDFFRVESIEVEVRPKTEDYIGITIDQGIAVVDIPEILVGLEKKLDIYLEYETPPLVTRIPKEDGELWTYLVSSQDYRALSMSATASCGTCLEVASYAGAPLGPLEIIREQIEYKSP